jgi:hypothetical protein
VVNERNGMKGTEAARDPASKKHPGVAAIMDIRTHETAQKVVLMPGEAPGPFGSGLSNT